MLQRRFKGALNLGCNMQEVIKLEMREPVRVDPDRLVELCVSLGEMDAELMIASTMEDLARRMIDLEAAYLSCDVDRLVTEAETLASTARKIGMTTFARVALDVANCGLSTESVPLAATLNRLQRIASKSLSAVWDMQDMPG